MSLTKQEAAWLATIKAVAEAIKELGSVPEGHLYAAMMSHLSLEQFQAIVNCLVRSGAVTRKNFLLTWHG